MLLTTKGRYAVMAIVDLAQNSDSKPAKMQHIAERQDISANYLEQIFNRLKNAKIVNSVKGPGGGYILGDSAKNIYVADVIKAVSEPIKFTRCDSDESCVKENAKCQTHALWKGLERQVEGYLANISIADICNRELNKKAS